MSALEEIDALDRAVMAAVSRTPTPRLDVAMRSLTEAANYSRLSIASAAAMASLGGADGRRAAARGLASVVATAAIVNLAVKPALRRRRPERGDEPAPGRAVRMPRTASFPSGHAAAAFAFATGAGRAMPAVAAPLSLLATLVAYSRVHVGVHYPTDVVAGALIGVGVAEATVRRLGR